MLLKCSIKKKRSRLNHKITAVFWNETLITARKKLYGIKGYWVDVFNFLRNYGELVHVWLSWKLCVLPGFFSPRGRVFGFCLLSKKSKIAFKILGPVYFWSPRKKITNRKFGCHESWNVSFNLHNLIKPLKSTNKACWFLETGFYFSIF